MLRRLFGAKRFVWNWALRRKNEAFAADGTRLGWVELSRELTALRQAEETAWLAELPREPFQQTLRDFDTAWRKFFAGRARRPRHKKRGTVNSLRFTLDQRREQVDRAGGYVKLPGLGDVRFRVTEPLEGRLRSVTISQDSAERVFACFTADGVPAPEAAPAVRDFVGVDMGMRRLVTVSTGSKVDAARALAKKQIRLRRYQRSYARKMTVAKAKVGLGPRQPIPKGTVLPVSDRAARLQQKIGVLHARIADTRRDFLHQVSRRIVNMAQIIAIEDLAVAGLGKAMRRAFRRSVYDTAMGELRRQIEYKAAWAGRQVVAVDRFFPSSKRCSGCGAINANLSIKDRYWSCPECGAAHDRDVNAAVNIEQEGQRLLLSAGSCTAGSAGTNARGEAACAAGGVLPVGQPTSLNREEALYAGRRPILVRDGTGP